MQREADPITIDHIIDLRKEISRLDKELDQYKQAHAKIIAEQSKLIQELKDLRSARPSDQPLPYPGYRD